MMHIHQAILIPVVLEHSSWSSCRESTRDLRMLGHLVFTKDPEGRDYL